ncbi:Fpg/Nei family DNA glycosylase [Edaphobacter modestus]|uniref:DNA-(apurinic or apyrimidinic site) lyase n=1 Tax=Edaphobacter modestus TaxID=388466 RepID=A0A4Q7YUE3_9BACT|nr:zinc finger domain-containing protein [Edaphobacter modestus]RZU40589.1 endonuclease-8 [Edaphobacter modestus]
MPEGNEIHRWAARHQVAFAGRPVRVDGPQGRFTDADVIDGRKLERVLAVGKHLGYDFGKDRILHVHLGLQGDFTEGSGPLPPVKGALRLRMWNAAAIRKPAVPGESKRHAWYSEDDGTGHLDPEQIAWVELRGPMDCSLYTQEKWDELVNRLGPDPLNGDGPDKMIAKVRKSRKSIGELLMDQTLFAGIGNIFRAELLYRARLSPFRSGRDVEETTLQSIWKDAGLLMPAAMIDRRIVTTKPADRPHKRGKVLKEEAHYVYRRNGLPCFVCDTTVKKEEVAGRNLFWCPTCQAE